MIIALAGRRIDAPDATTPRFPLDQAATVGERIRAFLFEHTATTLVCAAACGADLLALDAAGELGIQRHIVLPFEPQQFRALSVTDRPGAWGPVFDRIITEVQAADHLVVLNRNGTDEEPFAATNRAILEQALTLAQHAPAEPGVRAAPPVLAVLVWDGQSRGEGDLTLNFAQEARVQGLPVLEIATM